MTEEAKTYIYYRSDNQVPYAIDREEQPFGDYIPYPFVAEAPDPSIKSPKYDWNKREWFEFAPDAQGQLINQLSADVKNVKTDTQSIKEDKAKVDQTLTSLQTGQTTIGQQVGNVVDMMSQMMAAMAGTPTADTGKEAE
ncbi:hypothetical protein OZX69_03055 [Lactobacillus sp. ESL0731]|uniref:hypothetical protein n=1 Tax=unclassified Lactobacillus TaxID=2620435 RepID=UPI0023F9304E|nr:MULTISPECIES: hypothetical protein [unclassified Lactobacillus]WEV51688.1 hypothetical protein OZX63_03055 [Lactobacillus sp. ESL0700]WEV62817.1 hypothetical protein OZX69_03055 [Lactobacillus sp. ESL0731]